MWRFLTRSDLQALDMPMLRREIRGLFMPRDGLYMSFEYFAAIALWCNDKVISDYPSGSKRKLATQCR